MSVDYFFKYKTSLIIFLLFGSFFSFLVFADFQGTSDKCIAACTSARPNDINNCIKFCVAENISPCKSGCHFPGEEKCSLGNESVQICQLQDGVSGRCDWGNLQQCSPNGTCNGTTHKSGEIEYVAASCLPKPDCSNKDESKCTKVGSFCNENGEIVSCSYKKEGDVVDKTICLSNIYSCSKNERCVGNYGTSFAKCILKESPLIESGFGGANSSCLRPGVLRCAPDLGSVQQCKEVAPFVGAWVPMHICQNGELCIREWGCVKRFCLYGGQKIPVNSNFYIGNKNKKATCLPKVGGVDVSIEDCPENQICNSGQCVPEVADTTNQSLNNSPASSDLAGEAGQLPCIAGSYASTQINRPSNPLLDFLKRVFIGSSS